MVMTVTSLAIFAASFYAVISVMVSTLAPALPRIRDILMATGVNAAKMSSPRFAGGYSGTARHPGFRSISRVDQSPVWRVAA